MYYEEIFNRRWPAFWWSPDSKRLALMEFDDAGVPLHTVLDDTTNPRKVEQTHYPRAGETNPKVRLGVVAATGGTVQWADLSDYSPDPFLISDVGWWPDSSAAYCYVQNRIQTWLDLVKFTPGDDKDVGSIKRIFRDSTKAWIESPGPIHWLDNNAFLWLSERDGWKHLYQYASDGTLKAQLTKGPWEIHTVDHVDTKAGWIYFTAMKDNPIGANFHRVKSGGPIERLTQTPGSHSVSISPDGALFLASWSDTQTPTRQQLYSTNGKLIRTLDSNPSYELKRYIFGPRQQFQIPARDGFPLEAEVILPPDLDPAKKYPVWFMTYAGPHTPRISDSWEGGPNARSSAIRHLPTKVSSSSAWIPAVPAAKGRFRHGQRTNIWASRSSRTSPTPSTGSNRSPTSMGRRIGMAGHSYGGYMTSYAMTHSDLFAAGIAGAPVTDWREYDSIYTERYMGLPKDNPDGYNVSSVVRAAGKLHGKLLILHGAIDDNVSLRNTMRLVGALQDANKDFELMIYPSSRHGIYGAHYNRIQLDFIRRTLGGTQSGEAGLDRVSGVSTAG